MNPKTLISSAKDYKHTTTPEEDGLFISEFFYDTVQGENFVGVPSAFLRLKNCHIGCTWCDSAVTWKRGVKWNHRQLFRKIEEAGLIGKFKNGQHLVITGGAPLLQQEQLVKFIDAFINRYHFKPYIEMENECTIMPTPTLFLLVDRWNNSPKLELSGVNKTKTYHPRILERMSQQPNSYFKFVVSSQGDWDEIQTKYIDLGLIKKEQVVLMPLGDNRKKIRQIQEKVIGLCIVNGVRYSPRLHIDIWDMSTGV